MVSSLCKISIIIITADRRERFTRVLQSILNQVELYDLELIVIDCSAKTKIPLEIPDHVKHTILETEIRSLGQLRELGFQNSSGEYIVFLEEHCKLDQNWLSEIRMTIDQYRPDGIACRITTANSKNFFAKINDFVHFFPFFSLHPTKKIQAMPSNNPVFNRYVLLSLNNDSLDILLDHEVFLHKKLKTSGFSIYFNPDIKIHHYSETKIYDILRASFLYTVSLENQRLKSKRQPSS